MSNSTSAKLQVKPIGPWARLADRVIDPVMRLAMRVNGTPYDSPMLTHRWNNHHLRTVDISHLKVDLMVADRGVPEAKPRGGVGRHLPLHGWQKYIVLQPEGRIRRWYVGWISTDRIGVSRLPLFGPIRVLRGDGVVMFFAIDAYSLEQIDLQKIGQGQLGADGYHQSFPLV